MDLCVVSFKNGKYWNKMHLTISFIFKQTLLKGRHTKGQHVYEKMLNITNYQGNANSNYNEISPQSSQIGCYQNEKKIAKC